MSDKEKTDQPSEGKLRALEKSRDTNKDLYKYSNPTAKTLEIFKSPQAEAEGAFEATSFGKPRRGMIIDIAAPEFTCVCPITGQPDFATIYIKYRPQNFCIESKSLKLYLMQYRETPMFHEACVDNIGQHLAAVLHPIWLSVVGDFKPRGGIAFTPAFYYPTIEAIPRENIPFIYR